MLHIDNASIAYGSQKLFSHFNLRLHPGEIASISGPSGCGKTSLLNAVLGFIPLQEGHITVNGIRSSQTTVDQIRRYTAWLPQELALPHEWVREMVQLPFDLKINRNVPFSKKRLFGYFQELGLEEDLYDKRVSQISGGQRQRIMIAVAVMLSKPLIVVDEPTSALDAGSAGRVLEFFKKQVANGTAVLAVSHDELFAEGCQQQIHMGYGNY